MLRCGYCGAETIVPEGAVDKGRVRRCLICPSEELYVRKDFPQRLGITIIITGFVASSVAWAYQRVIWTFGILFGTALLDALLYLVTGNVLQCYRCHSEYRAAAGLEQHERFRLEVHERYRQQAARLAEHEAQAEKTAPADDGS